MIQIKAYFGEWKTVEKDQAIRFVSNFLNGITTKSNVSEKIKLIEGKHLKGITVTELLNI